MLLLLASGVFLGLAAHPFVTYPLSLLAFPRRPISGEPPAAGQRPSVAICMSAFNEERVIVAKVESLLAMAQAYGPAEVLVYVDGATDRTAALLEPYADRIRLVASTRRRGKTAGLNLLVRDSQSDLLAFTDANVAIPPDGLIGLGRPFADSEVGCATAQLVYSNPGETGMSFAGAIYWRIEEAVKRLESETVGVMGIDGAFFMIRRAAYAPAPDKLIDDLYVSLTVLTAGARVVSVPDVRVAERNATRAGEEFRRKARIACQAMNVHIALWPRLRELPLPKLYAYVSHRLLKWLMPFNLALAAAFLVGEAVWRFGAISVGIAGLGLGVATALAARLGVKPVRTALAAAVSFAGVGYGVLQSVFGRADYVVWTPAASIRD